MKMMPSLKTYSQLLQSCMQRLKTFLKLNFRSHVLLVVNVTITIRLLQKKSTKEPSGTQFLTLCCKGWNIFTPRQPWKCAHFSQQSALVPVLRHLVNHLRFTVPSWLMDQACKSEFERWQRKWAKISSDYRPGTLVDALRSCNKISYPNIAILLQIFATIPVITTTAERSFSLLRVLKTYLRSTMKEGRKEERLNGLALLAIHRHSFKYDDVITHTESWT